MSSRYNQPDIQVVAHYPSPSQRVKPAYNGRINNAPPYGGYHGHGYQSRPRMAIPASYAPPAHHRQFSPYCQYPMPALQPMSMLTPPRTAPFQSRMMVPGRYINMRPAPVSMQSMPHRPMRMQMQPLPMQQTMVAAPSAPTPPPALVQSTPAAPPSTKPLTKEFLDCCSTTELYNLLRSRPPPSTKLLTEIAQDRQLFDWINKPSDSMKHILRS